MNDLLPTMAFGIKINFSNFIAFPITLGMWWTTARRGGAPGASIAMAALIVVGYFAHLVSLGLTVAGLGILTIATPGLGRARLIGTALALSPLAVLGPVYRRLYEAYRNAGFEWTSPAGLDLAGCCEAWAGLPLLFEPGTEWNYSVATDVLGRVVEVASGQRLDEFFATCILGPLGMTDTAFQAPAEDEDRLAALYVAVPPDLRAEISALSATPAPATDRTETLKPNWN